MRMTGVAKKTVMRLLVEAGTFCADYQDKVFRNLKCERLQVDELWAFCYCKQKNVTSEIAEERVAGDVWLWSAVDAETKIVPCWYVGQRDAIAATEFIADLESRLARRIQLTSDAFSKKIENHCAAVALGYFAYNFIKIHRTLRVTPAMAAGVTDRLWEVADLVAAWEASERRMERAA